MIPPTRGTLDAVTSEGERCGACAIERASEPGDGGLCAECLAALHPGIEEARGDQWSPAKLGFTSLLCDVLMIPSILAMVRGARELAEVSKREEAGVWRPEHARVRSGAVLAFLTGGLRPVILLATLLVTTLAPAADRRAAIVDDELAEVLERANGDDPDQRLLAHAHLEQMAVTGGLTSEQREELLAIAEARVQHDDLLTSVIANSLARTGFVEESRLIRVYPRLTRGGKESLLDYFLQDRRGLGTALELLESDAGEVRVRIDGPRLRALASEAPVYLPVLFRLPDDHASRRVGRSVARGLCAQGEDRAAFAPLEASLLFDWAVARARLTDEPATVLEARRALQVLGCLFTSAADHALEEASTHEDPRVASAAVDALLRRGTEVPASTIARLASRLESRWSLFASLARENARDRMPVAHRGSRALAEGLCDWRTFRWGGACELVATLRRDIAGEPFDVHVFSVTGGDHAGERVALGPFQTGRPYSVSTVWSSEEVWEPDALADELLAHWVEPR